MSELLTSSYALLGNSILLSSIVSRIKENFIRRFPKGTFKNIYIKNSIASVTDQNTSDEQNFLKSKPALSINLSLDGQDSSFLCDPYFFGRSFV